MKRIILCCDLDRTVLPNGLQAESPYSRDIFRRLIKQCPITLVYVSGRDLPLLKAAIAEYDIPVPDYAIGDVGTSLYQVESATDWRRLADWDKELGQDWHAANRGRLLQLLANYPQLSLQEAAKQGNYKISFYIPPSALSEDYAQQLQDSIAAAGFQTCVISSIDETTQTGLIDILPANASKYHAIEFLLAHLGFTIDDTVFAGDSGNDLAVITSKIPSILVNNAHADVKAHAKRLLEENGNWPACYIAQGDWYGLNGNYSAGILEGLAHYHPQLLTTLETIIQHVTQTQR